MTFWVIMLGAFVGAIAGTLIASLVTYVVIGYQARTNSLKAIPSEILERVEKAKREYGIPDYGLDEDTLDLGMDPEE